MIIVFGSINMDMVFRAGRLPQAGETVLCDHYQITSGGKGANQALAAARMGAKVALVGCVGDDGPALRMLRRLRRDGVMTTGVAEHPELKTGCAVVTTGEAGQKQVVVAAGANGMAKADQVPDGVLLPENLVLMQMELPLAETITLIERAHERGVTTILNLAPAIHMPQEVLSKLDYLIVNSLEAKQLADMLNLSSEQTAEKLAHALSRAGNLTCIVTRSEKGAVACTKDGEILSVPAIQLDQIIDTTGAGDAYCGTFAAAIYAGKPLKQAMRMASVAGTLACTGNGAQESFAYLGDIEEALERLPE